MSKDQKKKKKKYRKQLLNMVESQFGIGKLCRIVSGECY
jgi:hypothetical protein